MSALFLATKAVLSGGIIVAVSELAKRNNTAASIVHSLPLVSMLALVWLYAGSRDTELVARHMSGTFWFVLPSLPMFLAVPWMLRRERSNADPAARAAAWKLAKRYSYLASFAIFILTLTGLVNSLVQIPDLPSLWNTAYGRQQ